MAHTPLANGQATRATPPTTAQAQLGLRKRRQTPPKDLPRIVGRIERDYQFSLGYRTIESICQQARAAVETDDTSPRAATISNALTTLWKRTLPHALRTFAFGRVAFEIVYRIDDGLAVPDQAHPLPYDQTQAVLDPESGDVAGVAVTGPPPLTLTGPEFWWAALDATAQNPDGRSRYLGAPWEVWRDRQDLERLEEVWYTRFAIGRGLARAPDRHTAPEAYDTSDIGDLDKSAQPTDPMDAIRTELQRIEAGGDLILSSKTYPGTDTPLYDYTTQPIQQDGEPLERRRQILDVAALRSLGIPERALTQDVGAGSQAMAAVHLSVLDAQCAAILAQLAASFQNHVVAWAVKFNWPPGQSPPMHLQVNLATAAELDRVHQLVRSITDTDTVNPIVSSGMLSLPKLLEIAGLPAGDLPERAAHTLRQL